METAKPLAPAHSRPCRAWFNPRRTPLPAHSVTRHIYIPHESSSKRPVNLKAPKVGVSFIVWLKIYLWLDATPHMLSSYVYLAIVLRGTVGPGFESSGQHLCNFAL